MGRSEGADKGETGSCKCGELCDGYGDISGDRSGNSSDETGVDRYHRKLALLAENILVTEEISMEKKGELVSLVESIMKSAFWERVNKAEKKLFETPFSIMMDKEVLPTILTGVIDLAFLESDGWIIADFKTDDVSESITGDVRESNTDDVKDSLESFVNYYAPQVKIYSRFWKEITKQPIKEAGLYFTSINKWVVIPA